MRDASFQRRLDMIEALEETHDDARLLTLINEDRRLGEYGMVLARACIHLKAPVLVEKLLTLPGLDQNREDYRNTVVNVFADYAQDHRKASPRITTLLKERLGNDQDKLTRSLSIIFVNAAQGNGDRINSRLVKMLISAGADLEQAHKMQSSGLEGQKAGIDQQLERMNALRARLG